MNRLFLLFLLFLSLHKPAFAEVQMLDRVVAVVNDDAITQSELDILLRPLYEEYRQEYRGDELFRRLGEVRIKLLNQLIEDRLVLQEAEDRGIEVSNMEIEKQVKELYAQFENEQELERALAAQGYTMKNIRDRFKKQAMIRTLHDLEIRSKIVVSPREIQEYYDQHPENFTDPDMVKARSLTLKKSDEAREKGLKDEAAWTQITELRERLANGEDFAEIAKQYSEDIHGEKGGISDWITRGEMIPVIDRLLFTQKVGALSEIVETKMGYHLFRVEEKKGGSKKTLDDIRDQVYAFLFQKKTNERFDEWIEDLKNQSYISVR